jgi:hypothetical protein
MRFVPKQKKLTYEVVIRDARGAFRFHLRCWLKELGIKNDLVQP